jgi:zinc/manganese transport system ATP-binding protein
LSAAANAPAIRLVNLTLGYDRRPAVHHLEGEIAPGEGLAVCGPNGAGKRPLSKLAGLRRRLAEISISAACRRAPSPICRRSSTLTALFPINVRDFVAMGSGARRSFRR